MFTVFKRKIRAYAIGIPTNSLANGAGITPEGYSASYYCEARLFWYKNGNSITERFINGRL